MTKTSIRLRVRKALASYFWDLNLRFTSRIDNAVVHVLEHLSGEMENCRISSMSTVKAADTRISEPVLAYTLERQEPCSMKLVSSILCFSMFDNYVSSVPPMALLAH